MPSRHSHAPGIRFTDLPNEILHQICVSVPEEVDVTSCMSSMHSLRQAYLKSLVPVTMTSRRLLGITMPLFYRMICIDDCEQQERLLRTMISNPGLRSCVTTVVVTEYVSPPDARQQRRVQPLYIQRGTAIQTHTGAHPLFRAPHGQVQRRGSPANQLWAAANRSDPTIDNPYVDNLWACSTRDAVIELFNLFSLLPELSRLVYISRRNTTFQHTFDTLVKAIISNAAPEVSGRFFHNLQRITIAPLDLFDNLDLLDSLTTLPRVSSLTSIFTPDGFGIFHSPVAWSIPRIRDLRVFVPTEAMDHLSQVLGSIDELEMLDLQLCTSPWLQPFRGPNKALFRAMKAHCKTLRQLSLSIHIPPAVSKYKIPREPILYPRDWSSFGELRSLSLLDADLYTKGTDINEVLSHLPPQLQTLTITAWYHKEDGMRLLRELVVQVSITARLNLACLRSVVVSEQMIGSGSTIRYDVAALVPRFKRERIKLGYRQVIAYGTHCGCISKKQRGYSEAESDWLRTGRPPSLW
ncbi:hypothetical protein BJX70DRAFT_402728 [Aspergillus crustosus]